MFACKNCGGNVKFDIKSGQLACEYCHSLFDPYAYEDKTSDAEVQKKECFNIPIINYIFIFI